jgi:8-oxo-dGTP pyrophosphatase MutT (NUDIX family)
MDNQKAKSKTINFLNKYLLNFPKEVEAVERLTSVLNSRTDITSRSNMLGHITASAIIVQDNQVLVVHHKILNSWYFPGGHFDLEDEFLYNTALREAVEETGLAKESLVFHPWTKNNNMIPLHIDIHPIPENPKKNEGGHWHFDFRYPFILSGDTSIELDGFEWLSIEDIDNITKVSPLFNIKNKLGLIKI